MLELVVGAGCFGLGLVTRAVINRVNAVMDNLVERKVSKALERQSRNP